MLTKDAFRLLLGLILCSTSPSPAWASHGYTLHILADSRYIDTSKYYVKISPPAGSPPNSKCMQTWYTPTTEVTLDATTTSLTLYIEDKNSTPCGGDPKYNTWNYTIKSRNDHSSDYDQQVAKGSIQFYHAYYDDWSTAIITRNLDGIPPNRSAIGFATCYNNKVQTSCLNRYATGKDAANEIYMYFRWPVIEK
ncbi:hypothetical protein [Bordetella sp. LUAb4]|uniref:hypothetical protein n=1 Tax=Bordetella sp. LUAb4 TaxID=2843195 RepID=UPI001E502F2C|nr:hypothetical protein [Bordetella sp. LUAb4]